MRLLTLIALFRIQDVLAKGLNVPLETVPDSLIPFLCLGLLVAIGQDFKELFK